MFSCTPIKRSVCTASLPYLVRCSVWINHIDTDTIRNKILLNTMSKTSELRQSQLTDLRHVHSFLVLSRALSYSLSLTLMNQFTDFKSHIIHFSLLRARSHTIERRDLHERARAGWACVRSDQDHMGKVNRFWLFCVYNRRGQRDFLRGT